MSQKSYFREFGGQVSQIVFLADFTVLPVNYNLWAKITRLFCAQVTNCVQKCQTTKLISPRVLISPLAIWPFYGLLQLCEEKCHKSYLHESQIVCLTVSWAKIEFCALMSQIVFLAELTVLRLITTVWAEMSKNSYLCEFWAQLSKIVFQADLTVLRFSTNVWAKMSQISYLRELRPQLSQIVFLADLTILRLITSVWSKMSQSSYLREFSSQVSQIVLLADLIVLRLFITV